VHRTTGSGEGVVSRSLLEEHSAHLADGAANGAAWNAQPAHVVPPSVVACQPPPCAPPCVHAVPPIPPSAHRLTANPERPSAVTAAYKYVAHTPARRRQLAPARSADHHP
jgi:hypothetical protein